MNLQNISNGSASVSLTEAEIILLNNVLNEVLHGIGIPEFATRLGTMPEEARSLLAEFGTLLDKMK